jgi:hypothetical protein
VDVITEEEASGIQRPKRKPDDDEPSGFEDGNEGDYLKSKIWCVTPLIVDIQWLICLNRWLGFALMNIGELGNFISYAWAPASVVAPLGTVSASLSDPNQADSSSSRLWPIASSPR